MPLPGRPPFRAFPKPAERPFLKPQRTNFRGTPRVPEASPTASPEATSPKASFETPSEHATRPEGQAESPFEICLMFRSPAESHPSKSPSKPPSDLPSKNATRPEGQAKSYPESPKKATPRGPSVLPSEHATCPRIPQAGRIPPDAARARHLSQVPEP